MTSLSLSSTITFTMFFPPKFSKDVFNRSVDYINSHKILNDKLFGFRPKHSTYMTIAQLVDKINTAVEKNETT